MAGKEPQKRGNREMKKPKQPPAAVVAPATPPPGAPQKA